MKAIWIVSGNMKKSLQWFLYLKILLLKHKKKDEAATLALPPDDLPIQNETSEENKLTEKDTINGTFDIILKM